MDVLNRLETTGLIPVAAFENAKDALPTAKAMISGGIDVIEITFRTAAAAEAIRTVAEGCTDMLVGAGTVVSLEQCKQAVKCGAKFIVSPGFNREIVAWCRENGVAVVPGCITSSEIMMAKEMGLRVVKFFPANIYGGLTAMKALSAPFGDMKFIPTGGVNLQNVGEYISAPFVHAVGGSWICPKAEISAGNFDRITALCAEAYAELLGFEVAHIGINADNPDGAKTIAGQFAENFGFALKEGKSSIFASPDIEIMRNPYLGRQGHIAIRTNKICIALAALKKKGLDADMDTAKYKGDQINAVYMNREIGGFAIHLLQK